jgi:prolipoprotein diacylglyceryltransferase
MNAHTDWFALWVGIGAALGMLQVVRQAPAARQLDWALAGLGVLASGLLGARALYVFLHPQFYSADPWSALRLWEGGLSWPGGLLGALLAALLARFVLEAPLAVTADRLAPLLIPVAAMCWLGCAAQGCAYGKLLAQDNHWSMPVIDIYGQLSYRWPLQYAAAISLVLAILWVEGLTRDARQPGIYAAVTSFTLALHTLVFSYWRADPLPLVNGLRLDYAAAIGLMALSVLGLLGISLLRLTGSLRETRDGAHTSSAE